MALFWSLWLETSDRISEDRNQDVNILWVLIKFWASLRAASSMEFRDIPTSLILLHRKDEL